MDGLRCVFDLLTRLPLREVESHAIVCGRGGVSGGGSTRSRSRRAGGEGSGAGDGTNTERGGVVRVC